MRYLVAIIGIITCVFITYVVGYFNGKQAVQTQIVKKQVIVQDFMKDNAEALKNEIMELKKRKPSYDCEDLYNIDLRSCRSKLQK